MDKHFDRLASLLHKELEHVRREQTVLLSRLTPSQLQSRGLALLNLKCVSTRTGLGDKLVMELAPRTGKTVLPSHTFKVGDVVKVESSGGGSGEKDACTTGVVCRIRDDLLEVALSGQGEEDARQYEIVRVIKLANETAFERQFDAVKSIDTASDIVQLCWERRELSFETDKSSSPSMAFFDAHLNDAQRQAVRNCIHAKHLALIHGPPGTGKTATLVEVIKQSRQRLLVCGPSNLSVDNLVERLASSSKLRMVRLGHPARMLPSVLPHSLDYQLVEHGQVIRDIRREIQEALKQLPASRERKRLYQEIRANRKELNAREQALTLEILSNADVILCTLNMSGSRAMRDLLKHVKFDAVVIDEGSQSMEPETWIAARHAKKLILAGDHLQLPPTVTCPAASDLSKTLFERLIGMYGEEGRAYNLLDTQYRMHKDIMNWASVAMYGGRLKADASVAAHLLCDLDNVVENDLTRTPIVFYDTVGCDMLESINDDDDVVGTLDVESKSNEGEAGICVRHLRELLSSGLRPDQVAIITPYNAQVCLIKSLLGDCINSDSLEIGSVDGFQGREKEAIIFCFVRSNDAGDLGFLSETRRTNVALTRARRHLCVIGDSGTLERHPFYKQLMAYLGEHAEVRFPTA